MAASVVPLHTSLLRPLLYIVTVLILCSVHYHPSNAQSWSARNLTILSLSSPQCVPTSTGAAFSCVLPAPLTVITSAVPNSVSSSPFSAFVLNVRYLPWLDLSLPVSLVPQSNNTWQCYLALPGYVRPALNGSLSVSIMSTSSFDEASPAFVGLSIDATPPPQLASIAGCTGSGHFTSQCDAESDELVLYGSGFDWLDAFHSYTINIGSTCAIQQVQGQSKIKVINDTVASYRLIDSYYNCAYPQFHYDGASLSFSINVGWYAPANFADTPRFNDESSGQVYFSFALLPPPEVDWFSVDECDETLITNMGTNGSSDTPYYASTSCNVSGHGLSMTGRYLYANVSIGNTSAGWYQALSLYSSGRGDILSVALPLAPELQPDVLYDLRVVNHGGELLLPKRLSFSNFTLLAAVDQCSARGVSGQLGCGPGDVITLRGAQFPLSSAAITVTITSPYAVDDQQLSAQCTSVTVIDRSTLTCVLPTLATQTQTETLLGDYSLVQASLGTVNGSGNDSAGAVSAFITNALLVRSLFVSPGAPYITVVQGCGEQTGPRWLTRCMSGDVVTVQGAYLDLNVELGVSTPTMIVHGQKGTPGFVMVCLLLNMTGGSHSSTPSWLQVWRCQLPSFDASDAVQGALVNGGVTYYFSLAFSTQYQDVYGHNFTVYHPLTSAFDVVFVATAAASHSTSLSALSSGAVAGVVLGALFTLSAVVLALAVLFRRHHTSSSQSGQNTASDRGSSRGARDDRLRTTQVNSEEYTEMEME